MWRFIRTVFIAWLIGLGILVIALTILQLVGVIK